MSDMNMPSFDDFLAEMGEDRIAQWSDESLKDVHRRIGVSFDLADPDDAQRFVLATSVLSHQTTVRMLRDYHEWLIAQLGQRSIRLL